MNFKRWWEDPNKVKAIKDKEKMVESMQQAQNQPSWNSQQISALQQYKWTGTGTSTTLSPIQYNLYPGMGGQTVPFTPAQNDSEIISKRIADIAQLIELYKREFGDEWKEVFKLTANDVMRR